MSLNLPQGYAPLPAEDAEGAQGPRIRHLERGAFLTTHQDGTYTYAYGPRGLRQAVTLTMCVLTRTSQG